MEDQVCETQYAYFKKSLGDGENWALNCKSFLLPEFCKIFLFLVFDTWALTKVPAGVLHGVKRSYGLFTECVNFLHESNVSSGGAFHGKYCLVDYKSAANGSYDEKVENWIDG